MSAIHIHVGQEGVHTLCTCPVPDLDAPILVPASLADRMLAYFESVGEDALHAELWDCLINGTKPT